jgi:hypothetical protein
MPVTLNGRTWALSDFAPWGFRQNWMPFFEDLVAELSGFQGGILRDEAAASAASAATSAAAAAASAGAAGTGTATGLVYGAALKSLVTAPDVVSVFVYDTRRDSDGGAWTEKCRGASWYNEAPNTTTRGATRRFPTVALIVARATSLTIYDAHDLDAGGVPRMWMVFNRVSGGTITLTQPITSVYALNGNIWVTQTDGSADGTLIWIAFADDRWAGRWDGATARTGAALIGRNSNTSRMVPTVPVASYKCWWVHAAVLPGAPLDSVGLPIPTVAVATSAGVSVIHPWGLVCNITDTVAFRCVELRADGTILAIRDGVGVDTWVDFGPVPYTSLLASAWRAGRYRIAGTVPALMPNSPPSRVAWTADDIAAGASLGVNLIAHDRAQPGNGMAAYINTGFATGWQPGDIRGAWLCDSATGGVAASGELITNGDFSGGLTGWSQPYTTGAGSASVVSGALRITGSDSSNRGSVSQDLPTVVGQTYLLTLEVLAHTTAIFASGLWVGSSASATSLVAVALPVTPGKFSVQFTAIASVTRVSVITSGSTAANQTDIDNISVRLALADRSYKAKGLTVNGTLTRTALPCGLAAVGGFSAANYLEQPYNPDLDFGAGDFCIAAWVMLPAGQAGGAVFSRAASTNPSVLLAVSNTLLFRTRLDGANEMNLSAAIDIRESGWVQIVAIRRASVLELWINGVLAARLAGSTYSLSDTSAKCRWGARVDEAQPFTGGSIALARVAASAPASAQIRRMYEDERPLIIGGQPALLGGTSANVTALASNPDTGSLLVGTGDGVSVFSGLARSAYYDGTSAAGAVASDSITSVSAIGPHLLVGTSGGAGLITEARIGRDLMRGGAASASPPAPSAVTIDATPVDISPRLYVGEGETRAVRSLVTARQYGTSAGQAAAYELRYLVRRDLGGSLALLGTVNVTVIHETSAGMDAAVSVDIAAQTVTERVTGLAATRLVWTVERQVLPLTMGESYAA